MNYKKINLIGQKIKEAAWFEKPDWGKAQQVDLVFEDDTAISIGASPDGHLNVGFGFLHNVQAQPPRTSGGDFSDDDQSGRSAAPCSASSFPEGQCFDHMITHVEIGSGKDATDPHLLLEASLSAATLLNPNRSLALQIVCGPLDSFGDSIPDWLRNSGDKGVRGAEST